MRHKFDKETMALTLPNIVRQIEAEEFSAAIRALGDI
jgi:hypothetical protein